MEKLIIYTSSTCPYCKQVKDFLTDNKIEFEERITKENMEEFSKVAKTVGMSSLPTIVFKDSYFVPGRDYPNPNVLLEIIQNWETNDDYTRLTYESLKTLNFNISQAFSKFQQTIQIITTKLNKDEHESTS